MGPPVAAGVPPARQPAAQRRSAFHFLVAGALLFALSRLTSPDAPLRTAAAAASDEELLADAALARGLDRDDAVVQRRLVRNMAFLDGDGCDAPALYDEARGLGLDASDLVVRRRLAQRMRFALEAEARADVPRDAELAAYLAAHADRFTLPARVSVAQVYLRRERADQAAALRARLAAGAPPAGLGDPLPLPTRLAAASADQVAAWLGDAVAHAAFALPLDVWSEPVASPYGVHLLRVDQHLPPEVPALDSVRPAVREAWLEERGRAAVDAALRAWRAGAPLAAPLPRAADRAAAPGADGRG